MRRSVLRRKSGVAYYRGDPPKKTPSYTGPSREVVEAVLDRANWCCERCSTPISGMRGVFWSVHHRRPRALGGTRWAGVNLPSNLLVLCGSATSPGCHQEVESHRADALYAGWLVASGLDPARVAVLVHRASRWVYLTDTGYADDPPKRGAA